MAARQRDRARLLVNGQAVPNDPTLTTQLSSATLTESCSDIVGNPQGQNPFNLTRRCDKLWVVNGTSSSSSINWRCTNYAQGNGAYLTHTASLSVAPSNNAALAEGLAKSNPNKPVVDLPVFAFELRDLPRMLQDWGNQIAKTRMTVRSRGRSLDVKSLPRDQASNFLSWEFGIKPLLGDISRMLEFQANVDNRIRTLKNLGSGATVRSATVWQDQGAKVVPSFGTVTSLYQEGASVQYSKQTNRRKWVSTKWKPLSPLPETDAELRWLAVRLAYGLDISFATLWQAMPWSWLIDWFSNVGDILDGQRNTLPVSHSGSCIMTSTHTNICNVNVYQRPVGCTYSVRPIGDGLTILNRVLAPTVVLPEFYLPFLDGRQLSILSALAATRR